MFSKANGAEFPETTATHTRPAQVQMRQNPSSEKEEEAQSPTPNHEAIYNWYVQEEWLSVFSSGVTHVCHPHLTLGLMLRGTWPRPKGLL